MPYILHAMEGNETIFGLASALGKSGVSVVRISGKQATDALKAFAVPTPKPRQAELKTLKSGAEAVDKALVLYFQAPHSFTGEDVVELHLHGSRAVIKKVFEVLSAIPNFRLAKAGEFSRRAFLNNKMDLLEAEGLADLIDAETTAQSRQAMRQMEGELGKVYEKWRTAIIKNLANIEAYIDFPDEDLPQSLKDQITTGINDFKAEIAAHLNDNRRGEKIREGIYVVILGAPNVGKSSLLNYLAKRDAAIVSSIAGTTRDVIEVNLELAGFSVSLADTAGLRESADEIETQGIKRALERAQSADLKILMIDSADEQPDLSLADENTIIVVNKIDVVAPPHPNPLLLGEGATSVPLLLGGVRGGACISIKTGQGLNEFLEVLTAKLQNTYAGETSLITRARHREALTKALAALNYLSFNKPIELVAEDLRHSAFYLGQITGKIDVEEILGEIFSSFCIGK